MRYVRTNWIRENQQISVAGPWSFSSHSLARSAMLDEMLGRSWNWLCSMFLVHVCIGRPRALKPDPCASPPDLVCCRAALRCHLSPFSLILAGGRAERTLRLARARLFAVAWWVWSTRTLSDRSDRRVLSDRARSDLPLDNGCYSHLDGHFLIGDC